MWTPILESWQPGHKIIEKKDLPQCSSEVHRDLSLENVLISTAEGSLLKWHCIAFPSLTMLLPN